MTRVETPKTFRDIQNEYDHLFQHDPIRDEDRTYRWHARLLLKHVPHASRILDIACGGGYFLRELAAESGHRVQMSGIDISGQALKIARRECPKACYSLAVAEALPFRGGVFDAIVCLGSLEHFLDIPKAIHEMKRIIKPDGAVYILVPNKYWYRDMVSLCVTGDKVDRNQTQEKFASLGEWRQILEGSGLNVVETVKHNGIAKSPVKQWVKDLLIPRVMSYLFIFVCRVK